MPYLPLAKSSKSMLRMRSRSLLTLYALPEMYLSKILFASSLMSSAFAARPSLVALRNESHSARRTSLRKRRLIFPSLSLFACV